jgi:hypothetical protein
MKGNMTKVSKGVSVGAYTRKHSTIASGATTIGSAGRAPDDIIESHYDLAI